jgi:hypothetical protein
MIAARAMLRTLLLVIAIGWIGDAAAQETRRAGYRPITIGSDPRIEQLARSAPVICIDAPGVDRAALQCRVREETLAFFARTLGN